MLNPLTAKVVPSYTGGAGVDLMSLSPVSPTPRCSSTLKGCSDPFTIQPPSVRTTPTSTSNGSNMGHQMRFDAFSSPVIQQESGYPSAAVDGALRASEQRSEKAALYSSFSNSPPLSAAGPSYPVYTGYPICPRKEALSFLVLRRQCSLGSLPILSTIPHLFHSGAER